MVKELLLFVGFTPAGTPAGTGSQGSLLHIQVRIYLILMKNCFDIFTDVTDILHSNEQSNVTCTCIIVHLYHNN